MAGPRASKWHSDGSSSSRFSINSVKVTTPRMNQIAAWLKSLGLEQYVDCFAENDIDCSVLQDLTDQDFGKIGVGRSVIAASCCARLPASKTPRSAKPQLSRASAPPRATRQST